MACTQQIKIVATALALSTAAVSFIGNAKGEEALGVSVSRTDTQTAKRVSRKFTDSNGNVIGGRPSGCPHRFCGCEASLYLFGRIIPDLNLAWNWVRKFPRATPGPLMAAARHGHVMVLISQVQGNDWLVHDGNSGGGLTREHVRSIKGYVIVDPNSRIVMQ